MGLSQSRCDAAAGAKDQTPGMAAFDAASMAAVPDEPEPPAHMSLPLPVKYEDMHKEAYAVLRPELFEGMRYYYYYYYYHYYYHYYYYYYYYYY